MIPNMKRVTRRSPLLVLEEIQVFKIHVNVTGMSSESQLKISYLGIFDTHSTNVNIVFTIQLCSHHIVYL